MLLAVLGKVAGDSIRRSDDEYLPKISVLVPVYNEESVIKEKLENTLNLKYPPANIEVIFISDGSVDQTNEIIKSYQSDIIKLITLGERKGKANALNIGLQKSKNDIIVFTDASILLDKNSLKEIVQAFFDEKIGCVTGEDHIKDSGGEGAYGRYELWLRNLESKVYSVVGASGSFYAQRKHLCKPFVEGLAPDFLSVLNTVEKGYRAVAEPRAFGFMTSVKSTADEFNRKTRTLIRGISAIFYKKSLMNILKYKAFSFCLISHKLIRWLVPFFLITLYFSSLIESTNKFYLIFFISQSLFYFIAILSFYNIASLGERMLGKIALYFSMVNISIFIAWKRYWSGVRQEIWTPSKRVE